MWPCGKIIYYLIKLDNNLINYLLSNKIKYVHIYDTAVLVLEIFWKTCICALSDIYKTICSFTIAASQIVGQ